MKKLLESLGTDLERAFDTQLRRFGSDLPKPEVDISLIKGRNFRFDRVWKDQRVVVELEGGSQTRRIKCHNCGAIVRAIRADGTTGKEIRIGGWHQAHTRFKTDIEKYNLLATMGYRLLRFTNEDVYSNPVEMVQILRENLMLCTPLMEMIEPLTPKELIILHMIAAGMRTNEMAERLDLSENTIRRHSQDICEKLIAPNRTAAVARAAMWGIIDYSKIPFPSEVTFTLDEDYC